MRNPNVLASFYPEGEERPLEIVFADHGWTVKTFQILAEKKFQVGVVDDQEVLTWPGYEADAEELFNLLCLDEDGEVINWSLMDDKSYRQLLYDDDKELEVNQLPGSGRFIEYISRTTSLLSSIPDETPPGCKMKPLEHIVCTPGFIDSSKVADSTYSRIVAYFAAISHDFGKAVDPVNGDHDTIGAEMTRTLLLLIQKKMADKKILPEALGFEFNQDFIDDVVAVIQVHHIAGDTTSQTLKRANVSVEPISEADATYGVAKWEKMREGISTLLADFDVEIENLPGETRLLFDMGDHLSVLLNRFQDIRSTFLQAYQKLTNVGGYAELARNRDYTLNASLWQIFQAINSNMNRIQALYVLSMADLRCSDKKETTLEQYRLELSSCIWGMLVSLDNLIQDLLIRDATSIWSEDRNI